jgi:hypothetical protein
MTQLLVYRCPKCPPTASTVALRATPAIPLCTAHEGLTEMVRVPDTDKVLLPLDGAPTLGPMKVETLKAAGILVPETQDALEWLFRHRKTNGMAGAFCKVGGRRCIDLVAFAKLSRERRA